jgi:hypothetical protein
VENSLQNQSGRARWKKWVYGDLSWRNLPRRLLRLLLEVYIGLFIFGWFFSDHIAFRPPTPTYKEGRGIFRITAPDGHRIAVLALTHAAAPQVILYAHGNAEDLGMMRDFLEQYRAAGFEVYAFDYSGYGLSDGKPGAANSYEDIGAVYNYLVRQRGINPGRIILHGHSIGAAVALHQATRGPVGGIIVESAFLTLFRVKTQIPLYPVDKMRNDREIQRLQCPVLCMHGEDDGLIPTWQGKKLFSLAHEPKFCYWVPGAGHNDVFETNPAAYWKHIRTFAGFVAASNRQTGK